MNAMPSPVQTEFPVDESIDPGDLEHDSFLGPVAQHHPQPVRHRSSSRIALLITFFIGIAVTVAWYSFGGPVREAIAGMSPQLAWVAPQPAPAAAVTPDPSAPAAPSLDQQISAASQGIDAVRQNVDRIAAAQEEIVRSIGQLTAGQEQLTKEITKLQAVEQYILYKNSEPPATRAAAPAPAAAHRPPVGAPTPVTPPAPPQAH
jgi:hypothetical protein